jgi:hypothetical protein
MKIAVYDTYVTRNDGEIMHFDILVPDGTTHEKALDFGRRYLAEKKQSGQALSAKECTFCHLEEAPADIEQSVQAKGYDIVEMEGCA